MKKLFILLSFVALFTPLFASGKKDIGGKKDSVEILVSAAASLKDAMEEEIALFETNGGSCKVLATYGSSGTLRRQIEQGAPVDIFISASSAHMDKLIDEGIIDKGDCVDMLENKVVLITPIGAEGTLLSFLDCANEGVKRIALGIPESVPAGDYARQVFESLDVFEAVKSKAVFAKDVRQVLSYVELGEVDAGVVYATDAALSKKVNIICDAPPESCEPIIYPAAVIKGGKNLIEAKEFFDFLFTEDAQSILKKYGFIVKQR